MKEMEDGGEGDEEEGVSRGRMEDDGGEGWRRRRRRMEEEEDGYKRLLLNIKKLKL